MFYRIQANQDLLTNRCTSITQQVYGQLTWPLGISEIGLQTNCQHGASKSKADKMQGLQITAFKKRKYLLRRPNAVKDDICRVKTAECVINIPLL